MKGDARKEWVLGITVAQTQLAGAQLPHRLTNGHLADKPGNSHNSQLKVGRKPSRDYVKERRLLSSQQ
jgi:hypothetical protein